MSDCKSCEKLRADLKLAVEALEKITKGKGRSGTPNGEAQLAVQALAKLQNSGLVAGSNSNKGEEK